ncbi:MAG: hypothetical protein SO147_00380 [Clostridia bacterium]|nr:hypothetical protein [Clostridia bacterium]
MFCTFCGKKLEPGEICPCRSAENPDSVKEEEQQDRPEGAENETVSADSGAQNEEEAAVSQAPLLEDQGKEEAAEEQEDKPFDNFGSETACHQGFGSHQAAPSFQWQAPEKKRSSVFSRFLSVLAHYLSQPVRAIRQAGEFGDVGVGLLCCLLQAVLLSGGVCFYLVNRVQIGYRLGFFEQAIPFEQYLAHAGSSLILLFFQLLGAVLLADALLLFLLLLFFGGIVRHGGISKMLGGAGTSLLMSGLMGLLIAAVSVLIPAAAGGLAFGGIALSIIALWIGVQAGSDLSPARLFYLLPLALLVWGGVMIWLVARIPMLSWISGLLW